MRRFVAVSMVFLAVSSLGHLRAQTASPSSERDEIVHLSQQLTDALARGDREALDRLLASDYAMVSPRGRVMEREYYLSSRSGSVTVVQQLGELSVRVYGTTAIVTSHPTGGVNQSVLGAGSPNAGRCQPSVVGTTRIDTWVKLNGRWQLAESQYSPLDYTGAREGAASAVICGANSDELGWATLPAFPGARVAVLSGAPYVGPYVVRTQRPDGHIEPPHHHDSDEYVSVVSGILHVGMGTEVDRTKAKTFREGAFVLIPAGTAHYSWAEGAVVEEMSWSGPADAVPDRKEVSLPRATQAAYVGTYQFSPEATSLTITLEGAQLMARLSGASSAFAIFPESETMFFVKNAPPGQQHRHQRANRIREQFERRCDWLDSPCGQSRSESHARFQIGLLDAAVVAKNPIEENRESTPTSTQEVVS